MTTKEQGLTLSRKVFEPVETHFTPGERSMVAWISTDQVDHERDVVVASGIDYKTYFLGKTPEQGNPCVLAFHDFGRWPLGRCEWIKAKTSREFNGLYAKTIFDDDPETLAVFNKIKSRSLRGISIGFRPPTDLRPGEWGPPTKDELQRRPDWKGAERIIRRCVLLEYSVCSLPMNPQALVIAVNKGVHRPVYSLPKANTMADETPEVEPADDDKAACDCGEEKCDECMARKAEDEPDDDESDDDETDEADDEEDVESKAMEADDFDEDDESELPIKTRDHVDVRSKGFHGCGVVEKIHRKGLVDHVDEDVVGTRDEPAARVRLYKAHGDGHIATERKMGVHLKHLSKRAEPFKAPSKKSVAEIEAKAKALEPLPPLVPLSEAQVQEEALKQIPSLVDAAINKLLGVV